MTQQGNQTPRPNKVAVTRHELERLMNNKLWVATQERLYAPPPDAVHHLELHTAMYDPEGRALITPGCVRTFALADAQLMVSLEHAYGVPAGLLQEVPGAGPTLPFDSGSLETLPEDEGVLKRFQVWRRALLFAFVWSYKQLPLEGQDVAARIERLVDGLNVARLQQSPLMGRLLDVLAEANQPPRARIPSAKIADTTAEVERWYWLGQFLGQHVLGGEKMDTETRQWFLQFKKIPYEIAKKEVPAVFEQERVPILAWLLFLRIYGTSDRLEERRLFEEEMMLACESLPPEELERVYQYALLFKGFFMAQADRYYISPAAKEVFLWLEHQALILGGFLEAGAEEELSAQLRAAALDALVQAHSPDRLAQHVYAYYQAMNPLIAQRGAVWLHELAQPSREPQEDENDEPVESADLKVLEELRRATTMRSPETETRVLLVRASDALSFFKKHYAARSFYELGQQAILFVETEGRGALSRLDNVLYLADDWTLHGVLRVSLPRARIYATEESLERLRELELFHPDALVPIRSLFPTLQVLMVAVEDYALTGLQKLWLVQLVADLPDLQKVIIINLRTEKKTGSKGQQQDDDLMQEMKFKDELAGIISEMSFFQLDMQKENYELIRWLRPIMRDQHWRHTGLWYLGKGKEIPEKLADAVLRAQSDVIVYDPQMRYMFYNL